VASAISLVWLASLASASAETKTSPPNPSEPLEKYDMPPAYIYRLESSPRMILPYGVFTSYQVNVDANGNNIVGDAANEPSIAVNPTDGNKMTIGWRQFNTVSSNFRQGGWAFTTDGGIDWSFPGVLESNVFRSDPVLFSNEAGGFFYLSLLETFCVDVWGSSNGAQSWIRLPPNDGGAFGGDKQWFTIDKTPGLGLGYQYQTWSSAATCNGGLFDRSTDGGVTWSDPIGIPNSPIWGTLDVASNHNVFIGAGDGGSNFWCIRSSNANQPGTPTFDQVTAVNMGGALVFGSINPVGLTGQMFLWVDRSGGPTNNNIYMLASVRPPTYSDGTDVMFVRSTDGGLTFSAPHRINNDPTVNKWHWFGTFSVAPNGRLDAVWYDTRNAANNSDSQLFYSCSTNGGVTWAANVAVSAAFTPLEGWPQQDKIGDYITIVSDNTGGNVAYSATFNFNSNLGQHEEDIYYVRVSPMAAPTPTPFPTVAPRPRPTYPPRPTRPPRPIPTATATTTASATPTTSPSTTVRPTVTPRSELTPRARPTPAPRP
jgi:hypothetical protein